MKHSLVIVCLSFFCLGSALGQDNDHIPLRDQLNRQVVKDWNFGLAGGANLYFGEGDSKRSFSERISPSMELSVLKSVSSLISFRGLASIGRISGWHANNDNLNLSDYEKFTLSTVQLHTLFNLSRNSGRPYELGKYELLPFAGVGVAKGKSDTKTNRELLFSLGVLNKIYLSPSLMVTAELRHMFVNPRMNYYVKNGRYYEGMGTLSVGLSYRLGAGGTGARSHAVRSKSSGTASVVKESQSGEAGGLSATDSKKKTTDDGVAGVDGGHKADTVKIYEVSQQIPPLLIFFQKNKDNLTSSQKANLDHFMEYVLIRIPDIQNKTFRLVGYSDGATGSAEYNMDLSRRRVEMVSRILSEKYNIASHQIVTEAKGDTENRFQDTSPNRVVVMQCY